LKFSTRSPEPEPPTAQTSVGEMAVTALSVPPPEIVGVVWMLQDVPLKNSTSGAPEPFLPTAQTAFLDKALTPESVPPLTAGAATTDQLVPLKFSISGPVESLPTAQMSVGDTAETALKFDPRDGRARYDLEAAREELARLELIESRGHRGLEPTGNSAFHWIALLVERISALLGRWSDFIPRLQTAGV